MSFHLAFSLAPWSGLFTNYLSNFASNFSWRQIFVKPNQWFLTEQINRFSYS